LSAQLGEDLGVVQHGGLMLAETREQVDVLARKMVLEHAAGLKAELLDRAALLSLAPYLGPSVMAAAFCPGEGKADPRRCALAFARAAMRRGAQVLSRTQVISLRREGGRWRVGFDDGSLCQAEQVVIAAGAWSGRVARMAGIALPISPIGLTMTATVRTKPLIKHLLQHAGHRLSMKQTAEGNVLIGGGWPAALRQVDGVVDLGRKAELLLPSLAGNMRTAAAVVPGVADLPVLRSWTGTTCFVADQLPLIGPVPKTKGLFIVAGSSAFTLGPTFADIVSDQVLGRAPAFDVGIYDPKRFGSLTLV
jgi:glycine/D-amino acid oxidase-like deaminating enzyme